MKVSFVGLFCKRDVYLEGVKVSGLASATFLLDVIFLNM